MSYPNDTRSNDESTTESNANSRRRFLTGSAGAVGTLMVGSAFAGQAAASPDEGDDVAVLTSIENDPRLMDLEEILPDGEALAAEFEDDIDVLNYALQLERLEAAFYRRGLTNMTPKSLDMVYEANPFDKMRTFNELLTVGEHEIIHEQILIEVIRFLGGEVVPRPTFDFGTAVTDPAEFLATAAALENTGVSAYNGAISAVESPTVRSAGGTIATVEGRHASFLNVLNGESGFPDTFDPARSRSEVLEIASQFIVNE